MSKRTLPSHWRPGRGYHASNYNKNTRTFRDGAKVLKTFSKSPALLPKSAAGAAASAAIDSAVGIPGASGAAHMAYKSMRNIVTPESDTNLDDFNMDDNFPEIGTPIDGGGDAKVNLAEGGAPGTAGLYSRSSEPRYKHLEGQGSKTYRTIESCYMLQWKRATVNSAFWRPVSTRVEIFDCNAHAETPTSATGFYPKELSEVRIRTLNHKSPWAMV